MINILDCKNLNYLDRLKNILNKRRFARKINTNIASQIVNEIKKTYASLSSLEKSKISHRAEAVKKILVKFREFDIIN